jgi:hypothetical protein
VVVKGKSMRHLRQTRQTCLEFPPMRPSEECVESKPSSLSAHDGAEKFVAELRTTFDVDEIIVD